MTVRRGLAVAATLAVVAGLGGCSSEEPEASPPVSASPSETATSPSPSDAPSIPPEAQGTDEESAKAFVRYWFETLSQSMITGDTAPIGALSTDRCRSCKSLSQQIDEVYEKGGSFRTKGLRVEGFVPDQVEDSRRRSFTLRIRQTPRTLLDDDGSRVDREPAETLGMHIVVVARSAGWAVSRLDLIR